jgi:hypothetical protein
MLHITLHLKQLRDAATAILDVASVVMTWEMFKSPPA